MIKPDWIGDVCYIFAGGPSLTTQPIELLEGRRRIVINSSYERALSADILFFHDPRWWLEYGAMVRTTFNGQIYTTMSLRDPRLARLRNVRPGNARNLQLPLVLSDDPGAVPMRRTAVAPALNIAAHKGVKAIVVLGLDGKFGLDGKRNHYARQYKWQHQANTWDLHQEDIAPLVPQLKDRGILVINASPGSAWTLFPIMSLQEAIRDAEHHTSSTCRAATVVTSSIEEISEATRSDQGAIASGPMSVRAGNVGHW